MRGLIISLPIAALCWGIVALFIMYPPFFLACGVLAIGAAFWREGGWVCRGLSIAALYLALQVGGVF